MKFTEYDAESEEFYANSEEVAKIANFLEPILNAQIIEDPEIFPMDIDAKSLVQGIAIELGMDILSKIGDAHTDTRDIDELIYDARVAIEESNFRKVEIDRERIKR